MKSRYVIYRIACAALAILAAFWLYSHINWAQLANRSGPAEWFSALLNLVMAGAAVAAFVTARNWLPELTTQEGYKLAILLVNKEFIWLGIQNRLSPDTANLINAAEAVYLVSGNRQNHLAFVQSLDILKKTIQDNKARLDRINIAMFQMRTYGIQVSGKKAESMNAMLQAFRESVSNASAVLNVISRHDVQRQEQLRKPVSFTTPEVREKRKQDMEVNDNVALDMGKKHYQQLMSSWNVMVSKQGIFTGDDHRIGKLFVVRKG